MAWKQSSSWSPTLLVLAILSSGFGSVAFAGEAPSPSTQAMAGVCLLYTSDAADE